MILTLISLFSCSDEKVQNTTTLPTLEVGEKVSLIDYVDPFIATGGVGYAVNCGYPGATRPLGMVKISPDTAMAGGLAAGFYRGGGYHYDDVQIQGFSHMHLYATGVTGYGTLAVMPTDGMTSEKTHRSGYGEEFTHDKEWASPGRYAVDFDFVHTELSATEHTAIHEYQFTAADNPTILLDLTHAMGTGEVTEAAVSIDDAAISFSGQLIMDGEMGAPYPLFFYGEFDQTPITWGAWQGEELFSEERSITQLEAENLGAWFEFPPESTVRLQIAISNVDLDGAMYNFESEFQDFDIEKTQADGKNIWAEWLEAIEVWGGSDEERRIFATALYHNLQMPTLYSDQDGRYRGFDGEIHSADRPFYTDFSLWDTYRTTHPLYSLLWPKLHSDLLWSLSRMAQEGNGLPRWPLGNSDTGVMLGSSLNIVFSEALRKGITDFEEDALYQLALDAMMQRTELNFGAPPSLAVYESNDYYPANLIGRSVAWTQEQSIADYALGKLALEKGDTTDGEHLLARANNWQNLWDPNVEFFHGRHTDGSFLPFESEVTWTDDYAEGNARQYLWLVSHDPQALFDTLGGKERSLERLEEMFVEMERADILPSIPEEWYWHGNEPTLHVPWFFALAGDKAKGDQWIDWLRKNRYSDQPDGLAGNDDGGTLSAWYVWASIGLYPLAGTTEYVLGEPIWDQVRFTARLPTEEREITIQKISHVENIIRLGQQDWTSSSFQHDDFNDITFYVP